MKKIIFAILLCLFATNVFCETHDGRWWNDLPRELKGYYIIGHSDGYIGQIGNFKAAKDVKAITTTNKNMSLDKWLNLWDKYPYDYTYGEIVDFVDRFYGNPQYKVLSITVVLENIIYPALKETWSQEQIDKKALEIVKFMKNKENK